MIEECRELELEMFIPKIEAYEKCVSRIRELRQIKQAAIDKEEFEILPKIRDELKQCEEDARTQKL